ncbi:YceI family protein [Mangrovimicrobium sediminis]|uniref:YceI family protein n=1 Tax=Mangrovimicrobium sediminis TaxID=2562682 RepID=A0A4Z0M0K1_9GAMM|nr:YceI family protein [Haliea sp. SAOS-164]TGD72957.1 YceI family protein [Haliea sp. SAOS-164]
MIKRIGLGALLLSFALPALAQWELDTTHSSVYFISVKNAAVAETHHFGGLLGYVGEDGAARVTIDLNSVETAIDVRNGRMREMLFETVDFPTATVTAKIDPAILAEVAKGATITAELPVTLGLHGVEKSLDVALTVFSDGASMRVMTPYPVLIKAEDFGLAPGVEALRAVAGLNSISTAVPVSFSLSFREVE